jgi:Cdc6-like AAA superfamily ATPase
MKQIIRNLLNDDLKYPTRRGKGCAWRKSDFILTIKNRTGKTVTPKEVSKMIEEVSKEEPYQFLMKTSAGYYFPKNEREWNTYLKARRKLVQGYVDESIRLSGLNYKKF